MAVDEQVLSGKVAFTSTSPVEVNFERQVKHLSLKVITNSAYVGFDTSANTDDALIAAADYWVNLDNTLVTRLSVLGAGSGTLYYIARR